MNNTQVKKIMSAYGFILDEEETKKDGTYSFYKFGSFFSDLTDGKEFYTARVAFCHKDEDNKKDIRGIAWIDVLCFDGASIRNCHDIETIIRYYGNEFKEIFPFVCDDKDYV